MEFLSSRRTCPGEWAGPGGCWKAGFCLKSSSRLKSKCRDSMGFAYTGMSTKLQTRVANVRRSKSCKTHHCGRQVLSGNAL